MYLADLECNFDRKSFISDIMIDAFEACLCSNLKFSNFKLYGKRSLGLNSVYA